MRNPLRVSSEIRFVLDACAPPGAKPLPRLPAALDWNVVTAAARRHQVLPLVAERIAQLFPDLADAPAFRRLNAGILAHQLRCQYLTARWRELLDAFVRAAIPVITLKGPLLAQLAYLAPAQRTFADLDLLVRRDDVEPAAELLQTLGYAADNYHRAAVSSGWFHAVEANFQNAAGRARVDLHWRLSPEAYGFGPDGEAVWERALPHELEGAPLGLSPEDSLIYLTVHAARHGWPALSMVADLAHLLESQEPAWELLFRTAAAARARRMLAVGLILSAQLLGAKIPAPWLDQAQRHPDDRQAADRIAGQLMRPEGGGAWELACNSLCLIERPEDRARCLLLSWLAPTLADWRFLPLPRPFYSAYYPLRQLRLALQLIRSLNGSYSSRPLNR